jgi:hypothetical protein
LVVGVGRHGGDGHVFARPAKRFVDLVAEHFTQVCDCRVELGVSLSG